MDNFDLRLNSMLGFIKEEGIEGFDDSKISELEELLSVCNERQASTSYVNMVADSIWDTLYAMLKEIKPDSELLSEIWDESEEDSISYTELLETHPMMSIETAKSFTCTAITDYINRLPDVNEGLDYFASYKINGHGIRVVYKDGYLVSGTSRARSSKGRDLTRQCKIMLPEYNEKLADYGLVELRGEACLAIGKLEEARKFNPEIKSPFSAVSSLIRPSSTEEEVSLLDFLCYGFIVDGFEFETREEEFTHIQEMGYNTPQFTTYQGVVKEEVLDIMKGVIEAMEEEYEDFGYYCDGVVFEVDSRSLFKDLGISGNHNCGNIALKVGIWKQDQYPGYVQAIMWTKGKSKLSPVAIVADAPNIVEFADKNNNGIIYSEKEILNYEELGVLTAQGNKVRRVPLYEPKNLLILEAYLGNVLYFRYGGEAGVVPCFSDGRLLKEDAAIDLFKGESAPWDYIEG